MIIQAATATTTSQPPGLFLLAWGLGATAIGLLGVTNFHGFAEALARQAQASQAPRRRMRLQRLPGEGEPPPTLAEKTRQTRFLAIPFAIAGPVVTVVGLLSIRHGHTGVSGLDAIPGPFRYLFIAFAAVAMAWSWLAPRGLFRPAARRGGWRLAVASLSSLCGVIFDVGLAMGQPTAVIAAWVIGGLAGLVLMVADKPAGPGPGIPL